MGDFMKGKKIVSLLLALAVAVTAATACFMAFADDVDWRYDDNTKTLYIFGNGSMTNYADAYSSEWHLYILSVENVVVEQGVTSIGDYAFAGASSLKSVALADSVTSIGAYAFSSCPRLVSLDLGSNIKSIADSSFAYDGITPKSDFVLNTCAGTYALYYAVKNNIPFNCESVSCGNYTVSINPKGMWAYYPYTARVDGRFRFYATGNHDTEGYLYSADFKQLSYNDDSAGTNFGITYNLEKGSTYYIAVKLFSPAITGTVGLCIEPVEYTVRGVVCAMLSPDGQPSDITIANASVDGVSADNGIFELTITEPEKTVTVSADGKTAEYVFTADKGDVQYIAFMMCDVNSDGIVNAKDYAVMKKTASPYITLFENFINYSS